MSNATAAGVSPTLYSNAEPESLGPALTAVTIVLLVISTIVVFVRLGTRAIYLRSAGPDDLLILLAYVSHSYPCSHI